MDIEYLLLLQNFRELVGGCFNDFLTFITNIAVDYYIFIPAIIIFWVIDKKKGSIILMSWTSALTINSFLKATFCVYRPWIRSKDLKPLEAALPGATGYSFPSGHASSASGFYSGLCYAFKKHKSLIIFSITMILLTMFSRNYVGVHTPQDVLVGMLVGILATYLVKLLFDYIDGHPYQDFLVPIIAIVVCGALLTYILLKQYPVDIVDGVILVDPRKMTVDGFKDPGRFFGVFIAFYLEKRFINFDNSGTAYQKLIRCLIGSLLIVLYWTFVSWLGKQININYVYFLLQASCPIIFMDLYPLLFNKIL